MADLDGDSVPDLVTANVDSDDVSVLLGNGDGSFQAPLAFAAGNAYSVAIADLDGDSIPDLVTAHPGSDDVSVLLNQSGFPNTPAVLNGNADTDLGSDIFPQIVTDGAGDLPP